MQVSHHSSTCKWLWLCNVSLSVYKIRFLLCTGMYKPRKHEWPCNMYFLGGHVDYIWKSGFKPHSCCFKQNVLEDRAQTMKLYFKATLNLMKNSVHLILCLQEYDFRSVQTEERCRGSTQDFIWSKDTSVKVEVFLLEWNISALNRCSLTTIHEQKQQKGNGLWRKMTKSRISRWNVRSVGTELSHSGTGTLHTLLGKCKHR